MLGHSAIGIDVSDGAVKAVLLRRNGRRLTLRRTWRLPLPPHAGPEQQAEGVTALLRRARPGAGTRLVLSAPAEESITRTYRLPAVETSRVGELVRYELLSELGVADDDLVVRHLAIRSAGEHPVHVYALRRRRLVALQSALASRGQDVDAWELPGWALASFVEHELPGGRDRLLLGVGREATDLVLLSGSGLWARRLAFGLSDMEPEPLAARLAAEADAAIKALLPADQTFHAQQVVLAEDGAGDARLAGELKKVLDAPLVRIDALRHVGTSVLLTHDGQSPEQALSCARAFGLALAGLGAARFACPAAEGSARREALRLGPAVAASVLAACVTLLVLGEQARARARELEATLPISRLGELQDRARQRDALRAEIAGAKAAADRLLSLAQRRAAVLLPRRALAALADITADRDDNLLHLDRLWIDAGEPGQHGVLSLAVLASGTLDSSLGDRLQRALQPEFPGVVVRGPVPAATSGQSQWTVEIAQP